MFSIVTKPLGCVLSLIGALVVFMVLLVVGFFWAMDEFAPELAESAFTEATGFPTTIEDGEISFREQRVTFTGIEIDNPNDFSEHDFLRIAELSVALDRDQTNEQQLAFSEIVVDIEELAFVPAGLTTSNLETFFETAEQNWAIILERAREEAAKDGQTMPETLRVGALTLKLGRVKLAEAAEAETVYRALDLGYEQVFTDVTAIRPVLEAVARELLARGLPDVAQPFEQAAEPGPATAP